MTDFDRIRREVREELRVDALVQVEDAILDEDLDEAIRQTGVSDAAIEWLISAAPTLELRGEFARESVARATAASQRPPFRLQELRVAAGLSDDRARQLLGDVSQTALDSLERAPSVRWTAVAPRLVATYLGAIGIDVGNFVRSVASALRGSQEEFAWRYTPGAVAEPPSPIEADHVDAGVLPDWSAELLQASTTPLSELQTEAEVFGVRWSPADVERQSETIARASWSELETAPMLAEHVLPQWTEAARDWALALITDRGLLYPAFQFDRPGLQLNEVVAEVNKRLGSNDDPWGAALWWFSESAFLGARPVDLVGAPDARARLLAAAAFLDADPG